MLGRAMLLMVVVIAPLRDIHHSTYRTIPAPACHPGYGTHHPPALEKKQEFTLSSIKYKFMNIVQECSNPLLMSKKDY